MQLSLPHTLSLRERFAGRRYEHALCRDAAAPVKKILMVGATLDADGALSANDRVFLTSTLGECVRAGIPVDPDFEIAFVNIDRRFGGEDFLEGRYDADLVMTCFIYDPGESEEPLTAGSCAVSPHHSDPHIWHESFARTGARYLCTVSCGNEVSINNFSGNNGNFTLIKDELPLTLYIKGDLPKPG